MPTYAQPISTPLSTYRLQFNADFTFDDATAIVSYLNKLGVSHCYASSYLAAVPGSAHGYDVADPTRLNPEIGDQYVFVAIDAETKLIPSFVVGKRDGDTALLFMADLHQRLTGNGRIQLTTDGFYAYLDAIEAFTECGVDLVAD